MCRKNTYSVMYQKRIVIDSNWSCAIFFGDSLYFNNFTHCNKLHYKLFFEEIIFNFNVLSCILEYKMLKCAITNVFQEFENEVKFYNSETIKEIKFLNKPVKGDLII